ncbi:diguanylate cyclase [Magnetovibrio sp. PR-2]|uniref:diguanylate cyclase n=1 Tax=Magnetovibrio sp. PR-2 TaxID=3120356 RepID=UPI002FCDF639
MGVQSKPSGKSVSGNGLKFLIVDDDAYYADQMRHQVVKACGTSSTVYVSETIEMAQHMLERHSFDVCLLSYALAEDVGLDSPVIARMPKLMTALIFIADRPCKTAALRALSFGAKDFIVKSHMSDFDVAKSVSYALYWKCREIELEAKIMRDQVTGLSTTPMFDEHLRQSLALAKRNREKVGVLMIGIEGMDAVQEDYGAKVGDMVLRQVGERISTQVRGTDVVARVNDHEFAAILTKVASPKVVNVLSGKMAGLISSKPYKVNGYTLKIGASVGASTFPDDSETLETLKSYAKKTLTQAQSRKTQDKEAFRPFAYYS